MTELLEPPPGKPLTAPSTSSSPTGQLIADITDDAGALMNQHFALLQAEMRDSTLAARTWWMLTVVGTAFTLFGLIFVLIAAVRGIGQAYPDLPDWAAWLIIGGALLVVGFGIPWFAFRKAIRVNFFPSRTLNSFSETVSWLLKRSK